MPLQISPPAEETIAKLRQAISSALPGAGVEVSGAGAHFEIHVVSAEFEGKNTLTRQRLVYAAIADLMRGDAAPVHAVDRLTTRTPEDR